MEDKKEILLDKMIALVKDFVKTEGGITFTDLESLFGRDSGFMTAISAILKVTF
jgi:hypothetical protein